MTNNSIDAPRDGTVFLADIGYPWLLPCAWSDLDSSFVLAEKQANANEFWFENIYERSIISWIPLPSKKTT